MKQNYNLPEFDYIRHFVSDQVLEQGHNRNWIAGAIKHPGALTRKAKKVGESPMEFAHQHEGSSGTTGRQARLAITLSKLRK